MGHPLPGDVNAASGLRYYLVAIPDDDAYSRAALSVYSELSQSYNWGLEGAINPDSETASQHWHAAIYETIRLIEMGFPDILIEHIDELESMLRALQNLSGCCPEQDVSDGDLYTDDVIDGVGSVPQNIVDAGFVNDANDWSSFATYKCMIAHVVVDDMEQKLRKLAPLVDDVGTVFGGIGAIAAIMVALIGSGGTVMAIGIIGGLGAAAALWSKLTSGSLVTSIADGVAAFHDELVCGFMDGDGVTGSISSLYDAIDENFNAIEGAILKNLNTKPIAKALYAGRYNQQDIAQTLNENGYVPSSFNCDCSHDFGFLYTWDVGLYSWPNCANISWDNPGYSGVSNTSNGSSWYKCTNNPTGFEVRDDLGLPARPTVSKGYARFKFEPGTSNAVQRIRFKMKKQGGGSFGSPIYSSATEGNGVWVEKVWDMGESIQLADTANDTVDIEFNRDAAVSGGTRTYVSHFGGIV